MSDDRVVHILEVYLANNLVAVGDLAQVITIVRNAFESEERPPVVVENTIQGEFLICLEDQKPVKLLKSYLAHNFSMTPEEYIRKWHLPENYPMVAPMYSQERREIAKRQGLGKRVK